MIGCSIILPSRNGADTLPLVLPALESAVAGAAGVEIILVDNASGDGTAELMRAFAARTGAKVLAETIPGKSNALNRAIAQSTGEMLVFLDDDAIPCPEWLEAYREAHAAEPEAALFAGAITAHWMSRPPEWLSALAGQGRACGLTPPGRAAGPVDAHDVKGANFAVLRSALGTLRFDTQRVNFGVGRRAVGGEDSQLANAIAASGGALRFVPCAKVAHVIGREEMTLKFQMQRFARIGRGAAAMGERSTRNAFICGAKVAAFAGLAAWRFTLGNRMMAADFLTRAARNYGEFDQSVRQALSLEARSASAKGHAGDSPPAR